jgi:hypothetical protein
MPGWKTKLTNTYKTESLSAMRRRGHQARRPGTSVGGHRAAVDADAASPARNIQRNHLAITAVKTTRAVMTDRAKYIYDEIHSRARKDPRWFYGHGLENYVREQLNEHAADTISETRKNGGDD